MNKDFQKLITRLQDEGISQYGITLLEGFAIDLENKIEIAKKSVQCNSCEKKINSKYIENNCRKTCKMQKCVVSLLHQITIKT